MNAEHERAWLLRGRAAAWHKEGLLDGAAEQAILAAHPQPWRVYGLLAQLVFFVLTCVGAGACYFFFALGSDTFAGLFTGVGAIALAELLIRAKRWWATGVEAALWIAGMLSLISTLPSSGKPEALLVLAAAFAVAGGRLRQPLFGTIAAGIVVHYFEERSDLGVLAALTIAALAMVALLRTWRRVSTEWLLILTTLVVPIAGRFYAGAEWRKTTIALYAAFGTLALVLALVKRHHAWFLTAAAALTIAVVDAARTIPAPLEAKLAAGGAFLLALSFLVSSILRNRTSGFVLTPATLTDFDDDLRLPPPSP
ncbi:MAG TPA: hypothetical protein VEK57_01025 [Thermoanaerobaculia bacterium]|nr:hypothetical protein [Thermoanaerobaculia bacterium]